MKRLCLLLLLMTLTSWAQEMKLRIFELSNRPAQATVEMVRPLLSAGGTVLPENRLNKLIVKDTPEVLEQIESLLNEIDQPAPHVNIQIQMHGVSPINNSIAAVGVSGNNRRVNVTATAQSTTGQASANSTQQLVVMSGEQGVINFAQNVPNVNPFLQFAVASGLLPPGAIFQSVSTGFSVQPTVVGEVVRMRVTPWLGFRGAGGRQQVLFNEASTSVAIPSGSSMTIASGGYTQKHRTEAFGLIFGSAQRTSGSSGSVVVTPVIQQFHQPGGELPSPR